MYVYNIYQIFHSAPAEPVPFSKDHAPNIRWGGGRLFPGNTISRIKRLKAAAGYPFRTTFRPTT